MTIEEFESGPVYTKSYIIADAKSKEAIIIDVPPDSAGPMSRYIGEQNLHVQAIVLTHGHWDHMGDAAPLRDLLRTKIAYHQAEQSLVERPMEFVLPPPFPVEGCRADEFLHERSRLKIGSLSFKVLDLPGHTPGHIGLFEETQNCLFSGDVIFSGSIGRTDFPGGDYDSLMDSICNKILALPASTRIFPGHGPMTTVQKERMSNPFILDHLSS